MEIKLKDFKLITDNKEVYNFYKSRMSSRVKITGENLDDLVLKVLKIKTIICSKDYFNIDLKIKFVSNDQKLQIGNELNHIIRLTEAFDNNKSNPFLRPNDKLIIIYSGGNEVFRTIAHDIDFINSFYILINKTKEIETNENEIVEEFEKLLDYWNKNVFTDKERKYIVDLIKKNPSMIKWFNDFDFIKEKIPYLAKSDEYGLFERKIMNYIEWKK